MRELVVLVKGDDWDDEEEAEKIEDALQDALDTAGFDYVDVYIR